MKKKKKPTNLGELQMEDRTKKLIHSFAQNAISDEEFNELLKRTVELDRKFFEKDNQNGLIPQIILYGLKNKEGKRLSAILVLADDQFNERKEDLIKMVGMKFASEEPFIPIAIFMSSEAWVRSYSKEEDITKKVSEYEDKHEAIVCAGLTFDARANMATTNIKRNKKNEIKLENTQYMEYEEGKENSVPYLLSKFYEGYSLYKSMNDNEKNQEKEEKLPN